MDKEIKKKLEICRKNLSADKLKKGKEWNGFSVFVPVYKQLFEGGWPRVVLVKDEEVRLSTYEECFAYGKTIEASGMYEEFEIAHKQGKYVFPIGSTGGASKVLAEKVLAGYKKYNDTPIEVEKLFLELNLPNISTKEIIEKIIQIVDLLAYRFLD